MKEDRHERARRLIDRERVEGISTEDRIWLGSHLRECDNCAGWASRADAALRALLNVSVAVPADLAAATSFRVRDKAEAWKQRRIQNIGLAVACAFSWLVGVASAPLVWKVCAWAGAEFALPRVVWMLGFAAWWLVPATAAAGLMLWQRDRLDRESVSSERR